MRPAKIGDIAVIVNDPDFEGRNIGKTCHVDGQCRCYDDSFEVTALEPMRAVITMGPFVFPGHCDKGDQACYKKCDLKALDDPDKAEDTAEEKKLVEVK